MRVELDVSVGELFDRISILELKRMRLSQPFWAEIEQQLSVARAAANTIGVLPEPVTELSARLRAVNARLWEHEEALRACERRCEFGPRFVELARGVYRTNDERAALKRRIDEACQSSVRELKSYDLPEV